MKAEGPGKKTSSKKQHENYPMVKRLLTLKDAATYMGRTVWGMRELIWKGRVPIIQDGRKIYLDIRDLDTYIEKTKETFTY
jgi:hypothetical protein